MMDAKYLAEIKARDSAELPETAAPVFRDRHALIAEVERLQRIVKMQKVSCSLVKTVEAGNLADENATLKKALELACEKFNSYFIIDIFNADEFLQQAQEGKK